MFSDTAGVGSTESARGTSTGRFYNSREARPRLHVADTVIPGVSGPDCRQRPGHEFLPAARRTLTDEQGHVLNPKIVIFGPARMQNWSGGRLFGARAAPPAPKGPGKHPTLSFSLF